MVEKGLIKFKKKDIPKLKYGIIHSQVGYSDGVSIVMKQVESVMTNEMGIPKSNIFYLVGKAKNPSPYIRQEKILWHKHKINQYAEKYFHEGYGGYISEMIEKSIIVAEDKIENFVRDKDIDVLIAHNSSHPVNFISSIALSRFYRDSLKKGKRTPKYLLWWHDSHLERDRYSDPPNDVARYLRQGVPGKYVEYVLFINSLQFKQAQKYFLELDTKKKHYESILHNHAVVYNTADKVINSYRELQKGELTEQVEKFLDEYDIRGMLKKRRLSLSDVQFCLQHTRIIPRKRIDFALEYAYELLAELKKKNIRKGMVFFVSGHHGDERGKYKKKLIALNKRLKKGYGFDDFFLVFAEDFGETGIFFEEFPLIFSKLGGFSTYFSEIEGFGNNLLEVLASGMIPAVYTYPVFVKDIAKYKFDIVCLDRFEITKDSLQKMIKVIKSDRLRKKWSNNNLKILDKHFSHEVIASKLKRAIIRKRQHM